MDGVVTKLAARAVLHHHLFEVALASRNRSCCADRIYGGTRVGIGGTVPWV